MELKYQSMERVEVDEIAERAGARACTNLREFRHSDFGFPLRIDIKNMS